MDETLQADFDTELTRLTALNIPDEDLGLARRYYSQKERKTMSSSSFCGPHRSFPITSQADVNNAARLIGHADNPDAVKACIKRKAKANGWKLPDSWTDGDSGDRNMTTELQRALSTEADTYMYVPITRIDKEKWEVEGPATSDIIDKYRTIFDFDSSKRAFQEWPGNVREMHNNKAIGRAIKIEEDDANNIINVRARVSKGAPDTWEKVLDGTLTGFSIGIPAGKYKKRMVERNGQSVPMYYDFELAEVSLVDNPGNPDCKISIVRADGTLTDVLDDSEEETPAQQDVNRAGARISHATQDQLHGMRDGHLQGVAKALAICMCEECEALCAILDPDTDGDIDLVDSLDYDNDGGQAQNMQTMSYNLEAAITRHMQPMITRVNAVLSSYAQRSYPQPQEFSTEPLERRIADVERAVKSDLDIVRSLLSEVKGLAEKIAAQPAPGGPAVMAVDKRLATSPTPGNHPNDEIDTLTRAAALVPLSHEEQIKFAAEIFKRQNRG